jgi:hypothetical protein
MVLTQDGVRPNVSHEVQEVALGLLLRLKLRQAVLKPQPFRVNVFRDHGSDFVLELHKF